MSGPGFTTLFGGNTIYPAQPTFLSLNPLTANIILQWPFEQQSLFPTVAEIIEVNATAPALTIQLSDARQISTGYCTLFNNIGANTFTVLDAQGNVLAAIPSGTVWELYLADNTTLQGTWRVFQFGAGASSANAAALAGAGLVAITTTLNQNYVTNTQNASYATVVGDRAKVIEWTGGSGGTITLTTAGITAGWFAAIKNLGTGNVTVSPSTGTIDGGASLIFAADQSAFVIFDGTNFYTLGFGQQINSLFDFLQINLAGSSGTVVLAGAQLNRISYRFIGALAGNTVVQVPATIQQYWVDNETTGAFSLTISSAGGGSTTAISQASRNILYCDGTNVVPAVTFGGTGFTNGSAAAPSIFFTTSPATGFFSPGANQIALSSNGTESMLVDAFGQFTMQTPTGATGAKDTLTLFGSSNTGSSALVINQQAQGATNPGILVTCTGGSGNFALMSICAQTAVVGTSDLQILQNNSNNCFILTKGNSSLTLGTNNQNVLQIDNAGQITMFAPAVSGITLTVNAKTGFRAMQVLGSTGGQEAAFFSSGTVGDAALSISNSANTGTAAPVLTANKPGASTNIATWLAITVDGTLRWIPCWAN